MKNIVFMGTPDFAARILEDVAGLPDYQVTLAISQPDRPIGRKRKLQPTAVKEVAEAHDIEIFQPENISDKVSVEKIKSHQPDLILTVAYGQRIPEAILSIPEFGAINVHPSLLPKYRGGAPIHYAVKNGDTETGVTIMYMVEEMDAGDMLAQVTYPIEHDQTTGELFDELGDVSIKLLEETLPKIFDKSIEPIPQNSEEVVYSPTISKEDERIDWTKTATGVHNHIRSLNPEPGAYTLLDGERFKIFDSVIVEESTELSPGQVVAVMKKQFQVACGKGTVLAVKTVQPSGKKAMPAANFLNGAGSHLEEGYQFDQ